MIRRFPRVVVAITSLVRPPPNPAVATTIAKELIELPLELRIAVRWRRLAAALAPSTTCRLTDSATSVTLGAPRARSSRS